MRITCFFVGRTHRRRGVADAALTGALDEIGRLGGGLGRAGRLTGVEPSDDCGPLPLDVDGERWADAVALHQGRGLG